MLPVCIIACAGGDASIFVLDQLHLPSSIGSPVEQHIEESLTTDSDTSTATCSSTIESMDLLHSNPDKRPIDDSNEQKDCVEAKRLRNEAGRYLFFLLKATIMYISSVWRFSKFTCMLKL